MNLLTEMNNSPVKRRADDLSRLPYSTDRMTDPLEKENHRIRNLDIAHFTAWSSNYLLLLEKRRLSTNACPLTIRSPSSSCLGTDKELPEGSDIA